VPPQLLAALAPGASANGARPAVATSAAPPSGATDPLTAAVPALGHLARAGVATAARAAAPTPLPRAAFEQLAVQIRHAAAAGTERIEIRMQPPVLVRVHVRLEVDHDHHIRAVISADRSETLELLQRDARHLQRALQQAGLQTDAGSLEFSLHGGQGERALQSLAGDDAPAAPAMTAPDDTEAPAAMVANIIAENHVDLHV
jgi:flagellar hook-length control protein FliK